MKIYLIGYRCTGKSTTGRMVADSLHIGFYDTDSEVEARTGKTISRLVEKEGWQRFRQIEKAVLFDTQKMKNAVVATGGGIVLFPENREFLKKNGLCIWLYADCETIVRRLKQDIISSTLRPPLTSRSVEMETRTLLKERNLLYREIAQMQIDTSVNDSDKVAESIKRRICL